MLFLEVTMQVFLQRTYTMNMPMRGWDNLLEEITLNA